MKKVLVFLIMLSVTAFGYHEFHMSKKAYKKVITEYYSDNNMKTEPDSTVTIYYDISVIIKWSGNISSPQCDSALAWYGYVKPTRITDTTYQYIEIYREVEIGNICDSAMSVFMVLQPKHEIRSTQVDTIIYPDQAGVRIDTWGEIVDFLDSLPVFFDTLTERWKYSIPDGDSLYLKH